MNDMNKSLESGTIRSKIKELVSISVFTTAAAILAVFLTDLIFFPIAYYSVRNVDIFNVLFKYASLFLIITISASLLFFKVRMLHRNGKSSISILLYVFLRPFQYFGLLLVVLLLISLLFIIIYFLFSSNYYHLHRIAGGV